MDGVLKKLEMAASDEQKNKLVLYVKLLLEERERSRVIGTGSAEEIICKHIYDSLYPLTEKLLSVRNIMDLGTGGGLPGIPVKIMRPECNLFLLEAKRKKVIALKRIVQELGLPNTHIMAGRAELLGQDYRYRESFDCIISRAVAGAAVLMELALPFAVKNGAVILYKGPAGKEEIMNARKAMMICGGKLERQYEYRLPGGETRAIYLIRKVAATPEKYPRRPGIPAKRPLS